MLREELAAPRGHPVDGMWAANGSNEILTQLLLAYGGPGRTAVVVRAHVPAARAARWLTPHRARRRSGSRRDFVLDDRRRSTSRVAAEPDVVFVCSPNNPTGNAQPVDAVARARAEALPSALVIVDEAYVEFGGESALTLIADAPERRRGAHVLEGVRAGGRAARLRAGRPRRSSRTCSACGCPTTCPRSPRPPGSSRCATATRRSRSLDAIRGQRDRIAGELGGDADGVTVYPSDANFVLFVPPGDAVAVWQGLLDRGVLVRDLTAVVPNALARHRRHAEHETDLFLAATRGGARRMTPHRHASTRTTKETDIRVELEPRRRRARRRPTPGMPFFDHMLQQLGKHAGFDLTVTCEGDLQVDGHHTVEDCGIALGAGAGGSARRQGRRPPVRVDHRAARRGGGRGRARPGRAQLRRARGAGPGETIDGFDTGLLEDFVRAFAQAAELTVHVHLRYGRSPHHVCEAEFKALANALGDACAPTGRAACPRRREP